MSWWQITLLVIVCLVILFFVVGYTLPAQYTVTRQGTITAQPETLYQSIATPKRWNDWSSWNTRTHPDLKYSYEGPESGKGASMSWTSSEIGNGKLTITQADPAKGIEYEIFMEGSKLGTGEIRVEPDASGSQVTWIGHCDFSDSHIGRFFAYYCNFDKLLGDDFTAGINGLREKHADKNPVQPMSAPMPMSETPKKPADAAPAPMSP